MPGLFLRAEVWMPLSENGVPLHSPRLRMYRFEFHEWISAGTVEVAEGQQADAHFAGWLQCPVCKRETRHCTIDTYESPVSKMRRIWCENCRVVQIQLKKVAENGNNMKKV